MADDDVVSAEGVAGNESNESVERVAALRQRAAEQQDVGAMLELWAWYDEAGCPVEAEAWCRKAAERNNVNGMYDLGALYLKGRDPLVPQDLAAATRWLTAASQAGHCDGLTYLADAYATGNG